MIALALALASCGGTRGPAPRLAATGGTRGTVPDSATAASTTAGADSAAPTDAAPAAGSAPLIVADADGLRNAIRAPGARVTLVNVWATWCQPCRAEFPDLLRIERDYRAKGLRFMLVSADFDSAAPRAYLAEQQVHFASWFKDGDDQRFIDALSPEWSGALPATFVYAADGRLVRFWEGRASYPAFEEAVLEAMDASEPPS
jgi:thiol-disulfide isomerase/thioredoxin